MKAVIAIDSFKGSLSSQEAGQAAAAGIKRVFPDGMGGTIRYLSVTGPLGESVTGRYGVLEDGVTAVMEMADAAGITMVVPEKRNPLYTTTYGVGETIRDAVKEGCRKFIIGIGGSVTNDGGVGMLQALGFEFLDGAGKPVTFGAKGLEKLVCIGTRHAMEELADCEFHIACDVKNVLCGPEGCSAVFGPQKGADDAMIRQMDAWLADYAVLAAAACEGEVVDPDHPGAGAAGGLGFAFRTFLHGSLEPGVELILRETKLEEKLQDADVVVTGEGRLDGQTVMGKAPVGVAALAKKYGKKVVAFSGCVTEDARVCNAHGIDAFFPIVRGAVSLEEAMDRENAARNMTDTAEQVFRLMR